MGVLRIKRRSRSLAMPWLMAPADRLVGRSCRVLLFLSSSFTRSSITRNMTEHDTREGGCLRRNQCHDRPSDSRFKGHHEIVHRVQFVDRSPPAIHRYLLTGLLLACAPVARNRNLSASSSQYNVIWLIQT
jgi:hypothetical protein